MDISDKRDSKLIRTRMFCNRNCSFLIPPVDNMSMNSMNLCMLARKQDTDVSDMKAFFFFLL